MKKKKQTEEEYYERLARTELLVERVRREHRKKIDDAKERILEREKNEDIMENGKK